MQSLAVYIFIYLALPIASIYGISKRKNNDLYLNIDTTNSLRGIAIITIMLHHIIQKNLDFSLLYPFLNFGYIGVALFFLLSGYGLTISYKKKDNYMNGFFISKFLKLYFPFFIVYILFIVLSLISGNNITFKEIAFNLLTMSYPKQIMWYLKIQLLMYVFFYFIYKSTKLNDNKKAIIVLILTVIYMIIAFLSKIELYWYITVIFFPLGVLLVEYKDKILNLLNRYSIVLLIVSMIVFIGITIVRFLFGDFGKTIIMDIINVISFNILMLTLSYNLNINSIFLKFIGKLSLELYLIHIMILSEIPSWKINSITDYILFFMITIILSLGLKKIENKLKI